MHNAKDKLLNKKLKKLEPKKVGHIKQVWKPL